MKEQNDIAQKIARERRADEAVHQDKPDWETPKLEDVSEQVMAQPYIRFT
jgi:hypothetical protein